MFYNFKKNFIYLSPQKTASKTIMSFLSDKKSELRRKDKKGFHYHTDYIHAKRPNNHLRPKDISKIFDESIFDNNFVIISIRNPYEHALSSLHYQAKRIRDKSKQGNLFNFITTQPKDFIKCMLVSYVFAKSKLGFNIYLKLLYMPYTRWFYFQNNNIIDYYIRLDHLDNDLKYINEKFNLNHAQVSKENVNKIEKDYSLFNHASKEYITNEYKSIIKKFNYKFPGQK